MTQIVIDQDWMIEVDGHRNHIPHRWKEIKKREGGGRELIPTGEFKWHSENKFFPNMEQSLRYILEENMLDNLDTISIQEYLDMVKEVTDYFKDKLDA